MFYIDIENTRQDMELMSFKGFEDIIKLLDTVRQTLKTEADTLEHYSVSGKRIVREYERTEEDIIQNMSVPSRQYTPLGALKQNFGYGDATGSNVNNKDYEALDEISKLFK